MTYRGHVKGGVIVLDLKIPLPEGTEVTIELVAKANEEPEDSNNPLLKMLDVAVDMGAPDLSSNIDHYLYGHPKVDNEDGDVTRSLNMSKAAEGARMKSTPITMSGTYTFNTFSYLWNGARSLAQTAKEHDPGSNYCRISSVLFSAFAIEAHLNHIGEAKLPFWGILERKLSWKDKLDVVSKQFDFATDYGRRPFQTLRHLFEFRNKLAHGKTTTGEKSYKYLGNRDDEHGSTIPGWLKEFWSDDIVNRALEDTQQILELVHTRAGFGSDSLHLIGSGSFAEVSDNES